MISKATGRRASLLGITLLSLGAASCGDATHSEPLLWVGKAGAHLPASNAANVFWVQADVNGVPGPQVIVDTGAPFALLNVEAFQGAVPTGEGRVATLTLGATILWKVPTVGETGQATVAPNGKPFGGIIGYTVFGQFPMSFDYQGNQVVVGPSPPPVGVEAPASVPFTIQGGGVGELPQDGGLLDFPASRVIVTALVEGTPRTMLLDTGASWVALTTAIFDATVSDGRGQVTDDASLATGTTTTNVTRLRSVSVAGLEVLGPVAASGQGVDQLIQNVSAEVGHPIDGLLGAPYLREFYVTVDYPSGVVLLRRYTSEAHVVDDYQRVGIDLRGVGGPTSNTYFVERVFQNTDAAQQKIVVDEQLLSIDGQVLAALDLVTADRLLLGSPGASHTLAFTDRTLVVRIDDLLPLP